MAYRRRGARRMLRRRGRVNVRRGRRGRSRSKRLRGRKSSMIMSRGGIQL